MSKGKKLALIAIGVVAWFGPDVVQASPLTEPAFVTYFSQDASGNGWRHSTGYLGTFVHWSNNGPEWSAPNISWVQAWSGGRDSVDRVIAVSNVYYPYDGNYDNPPWSSGLFSSQVTVPGGGSVILVTVPEPGSLALVGAFMGTLALRRRVREV